MNHEICKYQVTRKSQMFILKELEQRAFVLFAGALVLQLLFPTIFKQYIFGLSPFSFLDPLLLFLGSTTSSLYSFAVSKV